MSARLPFLHQMTDRMRLLVCLCALSLPLAAAAQQNFRAVPEAEVRWHRVYGGSATDGARAALNLPGRTVLLVGSTRSNDGLLAAREGLDFDIWLVKLSWSGDLLWHTNIGGRYHDEARDAVALPDGGFLLVGYTSSPEFTHGERDVFVVRCDGMGRIRWQKALGGSGNDEAHQVVATPDGGFLIVGETGSADGDVKGNQGGIDAWLIRMDADGNVRWQRTFGGPGNERVVAALPNQDGSFICLGSSDAPGGDIGTHLGGTDYWLFAVDAGGGPIWRKFYGGRGNDEPHALVRDDRGSLYLAGTSFSTDGDLAAAGPKGQGDIWVLALHSDGTPRWSRCYGGKSQDGANLLRMSRDGHLLLTGTSRSREGDRTSPKGVFDGWVLKLATADGAIRWQKGLGGFQNDDLFTVLEVPGAGYLAAGQSNSSDGDLLDLGAAGGADLWATLLTDPLPPRAKQPELPPPPTILAGYVTDRNTGQLLPAEITLMDLEAHRPIRSIRVDTTDALYQILLTRQTGLGLACVAQGYMLTARPLKLAPDQIGTQVRLDIELTPLARDSTINLYDIYFDEGRSELRPESMQVMNLLLLFLKQNPRVRIQIAGHTDASGAGQTKKLLSQMRANSIKAWLQERGVQALRLTAVGYGAEQPLVPEVDEASRALNRRVEIKILATQ